METVIKFNFLDYQCEVAVDINYYFQAGNFSGHPDNRCPDEEELEVEILSISLEGTPIPEGSDTYDMIVEAFDEDFNDAYFIKLIMELEDE